MVRGYYTAGSGLLTANRTIDVLGNNIANTRTPGFKRDQLITTTFADQLASRLEYGYDTPKPSSLRNDVKLGVTGVEIHTNFEQGSFESTERAYDLAIYGNGFFTVEMDGAEYYTRNGQLMRTTDGYLATTTGRLILGDGGSIFVSDDTFLIDENGGVYDHGTLVDTLRIFVPEDVNTMVKHNEDLFADLGGGMNLGFDGKIIQGVLEMSNVDLVSDMTALMSSQRTFQSNAQVLKIYDQLLAKTVTDIGRL